MKPEEFQSILADSMKKEFASFEERRAYFVECMEKARSPKEKRKYVRKNNN